MEQKILTTKQELKGLYDTSALTWEGLSTTEENLQGVEDWLKSNGVDTSKAVVNIISGNTMNTIYKLHGTNAYKDDLNIVSITGIDTSKVVIARFQVGARWFDDVVDNNKRRERK